MHDALTGGANDHQEALARARLLELCRQIVDDCEGISPADLGTSRDGDAVRECGNCSGTLVGGESCGDCRNPCGLHRGSVGDKIVGGVVWCAGCAALEAVQS